MRHPLWAVVTAAALASACGAAGAADDDVVGRLVVSGRSLCRVERVSGPWLFLVAEGDARDPARGWARAEQVRTVDQAIEDYTARIAARPEGSLYYDRGRFWLARREYDIAIADFDEVVRADPRCAAAYHLRGRAWTDKGVRDGDAADVRRGLADFDAALRLDPSSVASYCERGSAWLSLGGIHKQVLDRCADHQGRIGAWADQSAALDEYRRKYADKKGAAEPAAPDPTVATGAGPADVRKAALGAYENDVTTAGNLAASAAFERGAAYRRAATDFDAAIRLDPTDPRPLTRRDRMRAVISAGGVLTTSRP